MLAGQAGNRNLRPETTAETELGADFTLFNRLGIEVTKADSKTKNEILNVPTPSNLGFTNQWQNAGTPREPHVGAGGQPAGDPEP